jgi:hypothetical protein
MQGTGGAVIPFERGGAPAVSREEYEDAIRLWCVDRNLSEALSREEIGAMGWLDRMDAQRKAIIIGLVHYYRQHERSDVAPGVAVVLTLMSDNERGCASISQPTLAKLFGRSVSSIADAQRRLKEDGLIVMGRGRYAGTYPVIPRVATRERNHMTWLISALADSADKPLKLPVRPDDCQSTGPAGGLNRIPDQSLGGTGGLKHFNHPVEYVSIIRPDPIQVHSKNSLSTPIGASARIAAAGIAATMAALPAAAAEPPALPAPEVRQVQAECWQTGKAQMDAATNMHEAVAQKQVWKTPTGVVEVAGDFKAELLEKFPLVDLTCGLATAAANVHPERGAIYAMQSIRREFGYMQQREKAKVARAAQTSTAPPKKFKSYAEQEAERVQKFVDACNAYGKTNG